MGAHLQQASRRSSRSQTGVGNPHRTQAHDPHTSAPQLIAPEGFSVEKVWTDSASIFTRVGFDAENIYFGNSPSARLAPCANPTALLRGAYRPEHRSSRAPVALGKGRVAVPAHDAILVLDSATGRERARRQSSQGPYVADGTHPRRPRIHPGWIQAHRTPPPLRRQTRVELRLYRQLLPGCSRNRRRRPRVRAWDTNLRCLSLRDGKLKWMWNNGKAANMPRSGQCGAR